MRRCWRTGLGAYVRRGALAAGLDGRVSVPPGGLCASHSCRDSTTGQDAKWVWVPGCFLSGARDDATARQDSEPSKWNGPDSHTLVIHGKLAWIRDSFRIPPKFDVKMWPPASQNARMFLAFILMCADAASRMNRANFFDFRPKCVDAARRVRSRLRTQARAIHIYIPAGVITHK